MEFILFTHDFLNDCMPSLSEAGAELSFFLVSLVVL